MNIRKILILTAVFLFSLFCLTGFLVLSSKVPRDTIRENMHTSAEYLCEKEVFFKVLENVQASNIDRYADSILLSIAWQYDGEDPLRSVMRSSYYHGEIIEENEAFLRSVENGYAPNLQYLRYWHGSAAIVRILHIFLSLKGIYILNSIIMAALLVILLTMMKRQKLYVSAAGLLMSLIAVSVWFVPLSLEYTWVFILMLLISIIAVKLEIKGKGGLIPVVFLISGTLTNYLDFLTAETLTLTVPLILLLYIRLIQKGQPAKEGRNLILGSVLPWGAGYILTWVSKWGIASLILRENVLPYVTSHVEERLSGYIGVTPFGMLTGAVVRNLSCFFPVSYGVLGMIAGIIVAVFILYVFYVYRKKTDKKEALGLILVTGLLPFVRYLVLRNHSYMHYFFTYRALAAFMLALFILVLETTEFRKIISVQRSRR